MQIPIPGLLELPRTIERNAFIQPVSISNKCDIDLDNIDVIAIGNGKVSMRGGELRDYMLRHVYLTTISSDECVNRVDRRHNGTFSVICANPNDGASIARGDSGTIQD